ncbi:glycosylphosphatidylinositol anchor biosynthesis [Taxawa tesnikishii (nom. ined.)]|nr:glycosylphosphatidylinositol anchor biosynthesis [Dothideales sp. JES 119]
MPPFEAPLSARTSQASSASGYSDVAQAPASDSLHLRPEDAFFASSPPRKVQRQTSPLGRSDTITANTAGAEARRKKRHGRSTSRRKGTWKKLLWVKQAYPDNYTDEETFLDHLQRNPRLRPYEFWPLVADSTIIVQHICSVIIFICCFTGIFQERVSPVSVVIWATIGTVLGWVLRDYWIGQEEALQEVLAAAAENETAEDKAQDESSTSSFDNGSMVKSVPSMTPIVPTGGTASRVHSRNPSVASVFEVTAQSSPTTTGHPTGAGTFAGHNYVPPYGGRASSFSPRNQERLATAKSAILIYFSLLGLSPILKSLTKSTSSDSIWAISSWLMIINVFCFDYGAGVEAKFPASLSTNAALMASTVLASRLPSTTHVFSLTLFSIEVFGLFPVFRRHLRHVSWNGHLLLTTLEVLGAGGSLCVTITGGGWRAAIVGIVLGGLLTCLAMGMTSWWLIGLQRYKNEIHGPWDPARPVIRRHWD